MRYFLLLGAATLMAGCRSDLYLRDGVTDGDTFFLAPLAYANDDPAVASWVSYSLIRSTCQLQVGGDNPARVSTYDCEWRARQQLVDTWLEHQERTLRPEDAYLDLLADVDKAGFLGEYTVHYFGRRGWKLPGHLDLDAFAAWRKRHLKRHQPQTRLIGHWGYRRAEFEPQATVGGEV